MKTQLFIAAFTALFTLPVFAQQMTVNTGKTTLGARAGVNFQNINGKNSSGNDLKNGMTTGFNAGLNAEIPIGAGTYIQPGVLFSRKGADLGGNKEVNISYLEVPVNLVYKPILGTGNMILGFGPYVAFGIGGQYKDNGAERDVEFVDAYNGRMYEYKRVDAGGNILAGYEFANKLSFQLNAQLGLLDINPKVSSSSDDTRWRNTGWGISAGYRF